MSYQSALDALGASADAALATAQATITAQAAQIAALQAQLATPPPVVVPPPVYTGPRAFGPPALTNPITYVIDSVAKRKLVIPAGTDAIIKFPVKIDWANGIELQGGHNVVIEGVEVAYTADYATAGNDEGKSNRCIYLNGLAVNGTAYIAGAHFSGEFIYEGFNLNNMTNSIVQLRDYRLDHLKSNIPGPTAPPHYGGDGFQMFIGAGPKEMWIDGMTIALSDYQGIWDQGNGSLRDYRRINIGSNHKHTSFLGGGGTVITRKAQDVWIDPGTTDSWTSTVGSEWRIPGVNQGKPAGGDFVPASITGFNYKP